MTCQVSLVLQMLLISYFINSNEVFLDVVLGDLRDHMFKLALCSRVIKLAS